jgi:hypothetical protein
MKDPDLRTLGENEFLTIRLGGDAATAERLLLIGRPNEDGQVRVREWTSNSWNTEGDDYDVDAEELLESIQQAYDQQRLLGEEIYKVRRWLEG